MPVSPHHIIRQQYLHVELNGTESEGLTLQKRLTGLCEHWLSPAIERTLDRSAPPAGHLYIERLEIDAGPLTPERLEEDLADAVARALERALQDETRTAGSSPENTSGNISLKASHQTVYEAFIYFLKAGSLPWSFHLPEGLTLSQAILDSWQEETAPDGARRGIDDTLLRTLASETPRKRLVRQFPTVFLETLLSLLSPEGRKVMDTVLQTIGRAGATAVFVKHFSRYLWETAFAQVSSGRALSAVSLVSDAWSSLPATAEGRTALSGILERHWPSVINKDSGVAGRTADPTALMRRHVARAEPEIGISKRKPAHTQEHPDAGAGIYIENAGLVLLHPFLPQFFESLHIAAGEKLLAPERALCLLHFLTTGQTSAPEYALTLPKVLCGVPLGVPVESDVDLTAAEKEEAGALLEAVIRHWDALRDTSPDGLRGTFLLRPGKVSLRDGDWLLQVESRTYDILLEQLPWGISMIKLPWMKSMLWVEWQFAGA